MTDYDPSYVPVKTYFLVGQKCVVYNEEGKVLLLKRSDKVSGSGRWSLIGGGLEEGEDPQEAIKREAREEAQIELSNIRLIKSVSFKEGEENVLINCYQAKTNSEIKLNWEHDEYKWVDKAEALEITSGANRDFINASSDID